jgi:hypothetical protein
MKKSIYILSAILCAWLLVSFVDIITGNTGSAPEYWQYNAFLLLFP